MLSLLGLLAASAMAVTTVYPAGTATVHLDGTPFPVSAVTSLPTVQVQVVQEGPIPTPTQVFYVTITLGPALTPVSYGTACPKRIFEARGIWQVTNGQRIFECNSTGTPGPELVNTEARFDKPAEVCPQKWFILNASNTPVTLGFKLVESP